MAVGGLVILGQERRKMHAVPNESSILTETVMNMRLFRFALPLCEELLEVESRVLWVGDD